MKKIEKGLMNFIDKTPNAYYCVENAKKVLEENGFKELKENESWEKVCQRSGLLYTHRL